MKNWLILSYQFTALSRLTFPSVNTLSSNPVSTFVVVSSLLPALPHYHSHVTFHLQFYLSGNVFADTKVCVLWSLTGIYAAYFSTVAYFSFTVFCSCALSNVPTVWAINFSAAIHSHPVDRLFNDCEQWVVGGQDHELSREWNVGTRPVWFQCQL